MYKVNTDINISFDLLLRAESHPGMPVLTFEKNGQHDVVLTYEELVIKGNRFAGALKKEGIGRGDTFAVVMNNQPEMMFALYAALATGAIMVPLEPTFTWEKLAYFLRHSDAKGVAFSAEVAGKIKKALKLVPQITILGVKNQEDFEITLSDDFFDLSEILCDPSGKEFVPDRKPAGDHAMILYTSGTTGIPKGVRIRTDMMYNYLLMAQVFFQYTPDDRLYTGLPMTHGNAYSVTLLPSVFYGIPSVISQAVDTKRIWEICRRYNCTIFSLLGGLAGDIFSEPERPDDGSNPVRKVITAGVPHHVWKPFERRFNVIIHEWYGSLEGVFTHNPPGTGPVGSFGNVELGYIDMKVAAADQTECRPGDTGELMFRFRNKNFTVDYQKDVHKSEPNNNGWIGTGDMVHRDKDGWLFFEYRKENGLRRFGEFISSCDIEKVLIEHPEVMEVCVYGISGGTKAPGESDIVAAITPHKVGTLDIIGIFEFCTDRLPAKSVPSYIQLVKAMPKTRTEKVVHRLLKEEFDTENPNVFQVNDLWSRRPK